MSTTARVSRRLFLKLVVASSAASALGGCGGGGGTSAEAFGDASAGNVSDLPVGSIRAVPNAPAFIARDQDGLYAMTSTCTHAGCDLIASGVITAQGIDCRCHGSVFDKDGSVVSGPATNPLEHFAVSVDPSGAITVHGGTQVSQSTRTPIA
jgi:cytochrome b6-f complex iron-sulfur subunit